MSKIKEKTKKVFKWTKANVMLTVGLVLILIPVTIFGVILIRAYVATGEPINGNRISNERSVEITQANIDEVESLISSLGEVEAVSSELKVSTLRVYVDIKGTVAKEDYESLLTVIYAKVDEVLPVDTYFTRVDTMKQFDLEIHLYNEIEPAMDEEMIYYIITKNASMIEPLFESVTDPRNPELADELRGDTVVSGTIEGEEQENIDDVEEETGE
jgi:hypothetical protein